MEAQKNPLAGGSFQGANLRKTDTDSVVKQRKAGKLDSMLLRFAQGRRYHRFSAEFVADHCLPTTISDLQKRHGLYFDREFIKVPNRFNGETSVKLYWLDGDNLVKARKICGLDAEGGAL